MVKVSNQHKKGVGLELWLSQPQHVPEAQRTRIRTSQVRQKAAAHFYDPSFLIAPPQPQRQSLPTYNSNVNNNARQRRRDKLELLILYLYDTKSRCQERIGVSEIFI